MFKIVTKTTDHLHPETTTDYPITEDVTEDHHRGRSSTTEPKPINSFLDNQHPNQWTKTKTMEEIKAEILKAAASGELNLDPVQQIILVMGPNNHLWMRHLHSMRIQKHKIDQILENADFEQIQCSNGTSKYRKKIPEKFSKDHSKNSPKNHSSVISFNFRESDQSVSLVQFHMAVKTSFR
jgi:hypothetical protein